jgi:hypothetical protein
MVVVAAASILAVAWGAGLSALAAFAAGARAAADIARSLNGTATAHLHLIESEGAKLHEEGPVTGALPGTMKATFNTGTVFTGSFAIHTRNGTIDGEGKAIPHGSGRYQSFRGSITVTGGSGRYSHAHGHTGLYGTFDRRTFALVVQTKGSLSY